MSPTIRRGIFFDVENSSRPEHVAAVLDYLQIDRTTRSTDLFAVGNWRVASAETARLLASHGGHLIHSAPVSGVKDWSDLRIAVGAGVWLASARPGDAIEVVTDDQAFEAVGDVAAGLGVEFRRLSFRALATGSRVPRSPSRSPRGLRSEPQRSRPGPAPARSRGRHAPPHRASAAPHAGEPAAPAAPDEIRTALEALLETSPAGTTLGALSNTLHSGGFRRPPGAPRLVTQLRHLPGIEVTRAGIVRRRPTPAS